jgi:hypothetical protein
MIDVEQDETAQVEFLNGVTIGTLLYVVDASRTRFTDVDLTLLVAKRRTNDAASLFLNCGVIVGFLATLRRKGRLCMTSSPFLKGRWAGQESYCTHRKQVLTLTELCTIVLSPHGFGSAHHAGYVYGYLEAFMEHQHTVTPRLPGKEQGA